MIDPRRLLLVAVLPALITACVAPAQRGPGSMTPGNVTLGDDLPLIRGAATEAQARRLCGVPRGEQPGFAQDQCMRNWMFGNSPDIWE